MSFRQYIRGKGTLSARLSFMVLAFVTILFVTALVIMFRVSHSAIERESLAKAEEALNRTVHSIDNVLSEVEVATNNMRWNVEHHLDNPHLMAAYTREVVKNNPTIIGCAIAFEPGFYKERGGLFYDYSYRDARGEDSIVTNHNPMEIEPHVISGMPYMGQNWYYIPLHANEVCWIRPHAETDTILSSIVTCSTPIKDSEGKIVGILAADISVDWMSSTVLSTKPYPNSYSTMLGVRGTYLIHPDRTRLYHTFVKDVVKEEPDTRVQELVKSMMAGESGCRAVSLFGKDSYVLYRLVNNGHWSACIVCPENDIFAANELLNRHMITITLIGILLIFVFCMVFITWQMKPLDMLTASAAHLAKGEFDQPVPRTSRTDEIGVLQNSFSVMQQSLSKHIKKIKQLSATLEERNKLLSAVYEQIRKTNETSTTFIHDIADKMIPPVKVIESAVYKLRDNYESLSPKVVQTLTETVLAKIKSITSLLDRMVKIAQKKTT